jgi:hypothetical protein
VLKVLHAPVQRNLPAGVGREPSRVSLLGSFADAYDCVQVFALFPDAILIGLSDEIDGHSVLNCIRKQARLDGSSALEINEGAQADEVRILQPGEGFVEV